MIRKKLQKIGGSVGLILPSDLIAAADLAEGDEVMLTLHGRRLVVEPVTPRVSREKFRSSFDAVLKRHSDAFRMMAEFDRTGRKPRAR
jgi:antitoxin component of MazEF toxin-antitoxin module